jgi:predicted nucleotidyltransferase
VAGAGNAAGQANSRYLLARERVRCALLQMVATTPSQLPAFESDAIVREVVRRSAEGFRPVQVILFGSPIQSDAIPDSDYDFIDVMPTATLKPAVETAMHLATAGAPAALDLVPAAARGWAGWSAEPLALEHRIARAGRVVFDGRKSSEARRGRWLAKAQGDLEAAKAYAAAERVPGWTVGFHLQQAVE